jgi:hypothetical protein
VCFDVVNKLKGSAISIKLQGKLWLSTRYDTRMMKHRNIMQPIRYNRHLLTDDAARK